MKLIFILMQIMDLHNSNPNVMKVQPIQNHGTHLKAFLNQVWKTSN